MEGIVALFNSTVCARILTNLNDVFACNDNQITALTASGNAKWIFSDGFMMLARLAVDENGNLQLPRRKSWEPGQREQLTSPMSGYSKWIRRKRAMAQTPFVARAQTLALDHGHLYVTTEKGFNCYEPNGDEIEGLGG